VVFNLGPLVDLPADPAGIRALGPVEILAIDNALLRRALERDPKLGYRFLHNLCRLSMEQYERQITRLLA
jgi:CRP-like cAMP-binding protein